MSRIRAALLAVLTTAGALVGGVLGVSPAMADTTLCDALASTTTSGGQYIVMNNRWGSSAPQCINVTASGFAITTSGANNPTNGPPASYPAVYWGCHYGNCTPGFSPVPVNSSAFSALSTNVSMSYPSSGQYDAAYDIWFDPTARRDGQNTGAEVMVWLNHAGAPQPIGSRVATVSLAGGTWDVWFGNVGWNVISYVRTSGTGSITFPIRTFYDDVVTRGYGQRSWYLTSVQAGFEPWTGGAGLAVTAFGVSTAGTSPSSLPTPTPTSPTSPTPPSPSATPSSSATPTTSPSSSGCRVQVAQNGWNGGYTADVTLTNTGSTTVNGWTSTFQLGAGQAVTGFWNADITASGTAATARNLSYNATIAPGASVSFGLQARSSAGNTAPSAFTLNGRSCTS